MSKELDALIARVERVYAQDEFNAGEITKSYIKKYYDENALGFKYFHSFEGCVHMGLSKNKKFQKTRLLRTSQKNRFPYQKTKNRKGLLILKYWNLAVAMGSIFPI